jgi:hypothetical protein
MSSLALARFDDSGNVLWSKSFGGAGAAFTVGSVGGNAAGGIVLTGGYTGSVDFGLGPLPASGDTFVARFDAKGMIAWNKSVTVGSSSVLVAAIGPCGVLVATNSPSVNFGSGPLATKTNGVASVGVAALGM